jgi:hypothetical protein
MPNIVERAKSVCMSPDSTWAAIASERTDAAPLITGYVLPLAGAAAVAQAIGFAVVGKISACSAPTACPSRLPWAWRSRVWSSLRSVWC